MTSKLLIKFSIIVNFLEASLYCHLMIGSDMTNFNYITNQSRSGDEGFFDLTPLKIKSVSSGVFIEGLSPNQMRIMGLLYLRLRVDRTCYDDGNRLFGQLACTFG